MSTTDHKDYCPLSLHELRRYPSAECICNTAKPNDITCTFCGFAGGKKN